MAQYFPKAWLTAKNGGRINEIDLKQIKNTSTKIEAGGTPVKARIDMGEQVAGAGLCPECRQPTIGPVHCNGHVVRWCATDRIALPYKDGEE
jgi:hypothetical protein